MPGRRQRTANEPLEEPSFGNDPADDEARAALSSLASRTIAEFPFKIPGRRKNKLGPSPRWDPFWRPSIVEAAKELGVAVIHVNDQVCTRTQTEAERVRATANSIWDLKHKTFAARATGR